MPKGLVTDNDALALFFNATALPWAGITNLYLALHTADPTSGGNQQSSEATYTSYARVAIVRTSGGWTVSTNTSQNAALAQFPQCTGGTNVLTHVSIGTLNTGTGQIVYVGALNSSLTVSNLIQPQFAIGALVATET